MTADQAIAMVGYIITAIVLILVVIGIALLTQL